MVTDDKPIIINKESVAPGETRRFVVNIARLPSHAEIDLSIIVKRATEPGPSVLLMGGLHGDEINGVEIVRRLMQDDNLVLSKGSLIFIPILNVFGFINFSRYVPDGKDVNRSFPGNKNGSLAARVANYLMKEIIPQIDYGIDFHTGAADRTNYPQIRCMMDDKDNRELATAFQAPFTVHSKYRTKSLRQTAARLGKRILVYEGGESLRFDEYAIKEGIEGTKRFLKSLDLLENAPSAENDSIIIRSSSWVRAKISGVFTSYVKSGEPVSKNQVVGMISDPLGDNQSIKIKAPVTGFVIGLNYNPVVHQGDALMHLGKAG